MHVEKVASQPVPNAAMPVLTVENLVVRHGLGSGRKLEAVADVSFEVNRGETFGIVGESGCGKSSLARALIQMPPPTEGAIHFAGARMTGLPGKELRELRPRVQMIFQDPVSSLHPRRRVFDIVADPLRVWGREDDLQRRVHSAMDAVGLSPAHSARRPHELSGGQCQRVSIARALMLDPELLICDEPVSALDVSVQAQILNLLEDLKAQFGLTIVFISHDLGVVRHTSDRVAVMYLGRLCEVGPTDEVFSNSRHPYTRLLVSSRPGMGGSTEAFESDVAEIPSPLDPPSGCRFRTRCPLADERCANETPELRTLAAGHQVACHRPLELRRTLNNQSTGVLPADAASTDPVSGRTET